jgi:hypothetical protein
VDNKEFFMKNFFKCFGIIAFVAVIGFSLVSCGPKPNTDPKTIVITGLANSYTYGDIGLFTAGTSLEDVAQNKGFVAGASWENEDIVHTGGSITYPLYNPGTNSGRWKGNGTFDVYFLYTTGTYNADTNPTKVYKASVSFTEATTSVAFSKFIDTGISM